MIGMLLIELREVYLMHQLTMFNSSGPLTEMKLIPASLATAFASKVLPQPEIDKFNVLIYTHINQR